MLQSRNPNAWREILMLIVNDRIQIEDSELQFSYARSSGPGGQNVNKVSSKAIMAWDFVNSVALPVDVRDRFLARYGKRVTREGIVQIMSQKYRDQSRNAEDCRDKLREMILAIAEPPVKRRPSKPSAGARQRRLTEKHVRSDRKEQRRRPSSNE
jgi:ribosome-associated protein